MKPEDIQGIINRGGLKVTEAAYLFHASRGTVYSWFNGTQPTTKLLWQHVQNVCAQIDRAVLRGLLPLHPETPAAERLAIIESIVKSV